MKKFSICLMLIASTALIAGPCAAGWVACIEVNGYPDKGCDAGFEACLDALYPQ